MWRSGSCTMSSVTSVHVIVLGDVTRSPRILNQACYLASEGCAVTVSGFEATHSLAAKAKNIQALDITSVPDLKMCSCLSSLALFVKFVLSSVFLLFHLMLHCRSQVILIQSPPAVPTFLMLWLFVSVTGKKLVIDWHNYGFTLLELTTKPGGLLSRIYRLLELGFASRFLNYGVEHLCVSRALQKDLSTWDIKATVYYDRAPNEFTFTAVEVAHELFTRLQVVYPVLRDPSGSARRTRFTEITTLPADHGGQTAQWRPGRPALVVSSCSWTPDDDFTIIMQALEDYDKRASLSDSHLPFMVFAVTGRGPLKPYFEQLIREKNWTHVEVIMPWLEVEEYPLFLGCADLGISFHRSSSGLDLPMKVVDLMGVGVPVLALTYETLYELLPEHTFGEHFRTAGELTDQLCELLQPEVGRKSRFPDRFDTVGSAKLRAYRDALFEYNRKTPRGLDYWKEVGAPPVYRALNYCR